MLFLKHQIVMLLNLLSGVSRVVLDFLPQIDIPKCTGCELCVKVCPNDVLGLVDKVPQIVNPEACEYSGTCQEICPTGAISLPYEIIFLSG